LLDGAGTLRGCKATQVALSRANLNDVDVSHPVIDSAKRDLLVSKEAY
jgi:hypothetical protein